ncbi:MAG: hypothetical protein Q9163_001653 [Psora crenata]
MTEPEELDDDLFADLYDGDDTAPKAEPSPDQGFQPEPTQAPPPAEGPVVQDPTATDGNVTGDHMDSKGLDGSTGGGWSGFQGNGGTPNNFQNAPMDESRPIGIKEDG